MFVHAFTDGRDVDPKSGKAYLENLEGFCSGKNAKLASVIGRYYAMDRDKRWVRVKLAYDLLVHGMGSKSTSIPEAIQQSYDAGVTDEFIKPIILTDDSGAEIGKTSTVDSCADKENPVMQSNTIVINNMFFIVQFLQSLVVLVEKRIDHPHIFDTLL